MYERMTVDDQEFDLVVLTDVSKDRLTYHAEVFVRVPDADGPSHWRYLSETARGYRDPAAAHFAARFKALGWLYSDPRP